MAIATQSVRQHSILAAGIGIAAATLLALFLFTLQTHAAGTAVVRGIVKHSDNPSVMNLYVTHVTSAPDASAIRGRVLEVNTSHAVKYKWEVKSGALVKSRMASNPTPEQEVVLRGTLSDDSDSITAAWLVQNYRQFRIEGTLEGVTRDTGSSDEGWITVTITSSKFRNISPAKAFKETHLKGKDLRIRVNGLTDILSGGDSKELDDMDASQQKVRIDGQVLNEDSWAASALTEL